MTTTIETFVNKRTGEEVNIAKSAKIVGSKHFWKMYEAPFLKVLMSLGTTKMAVLSYIIENTKAGDNTAVFIYETIATKKSLSTKTVQRVIALLQELDFIVKVHQSLWMVNPDVMTKGNDSKREILASKYS